MVLTRDEYVEYCKTQNQLHLKPGNSLIQYIRRKNGQPRGVVVAYKGEDNLIYVGYSLCNTRVDKFDKQIGINKAVTRAASSIISESLPHSIRKDVENMEDRASRFFK